MLFDKVKPVVYQLGNQQLLGYIWAMIWQRTRGHQAIINEPQHPIRTEGLLDALQ
jgi:hypothetical protein